MRIGLVTGEFPPMEGGVGAYTQRLAEALADEGHELFVLSTTATALISDRLCLDSRVSGWNRRAAATVRRWIDDRALDIVSLQYQTAAFGMSPWIHFLPDALRPTPTVTTFHDLRPPYLFPKAGPLRPWIVRRLAMHSTGVVVTNHEDHAVLQARVTNLVLIPIGSNILSTARASTLRDRIGAHPDDFLIGYFGLANRSKGLHTLMDALARLRADGAPARLVVIGGTPGVNDQTNIDYAKSIEQQIEKQGIRPFVHFTGYLSDSEVGGHLQAVDAVALPFSDGASYRRGSLMAALHHGCAIVTTRPTMKIPAFTHEHNLLLVPPDDGQSLADSLKRLWHEPELRDRLKREAANTSGLFAWASIARDYSAFFQHMAERSS